MTAQETRTVAAPARPPAAWPRAATLIGTSLGFGVIQLDVTVVNVAVKAIGGTFGGGIAELQWVVSSYVLVFAALIAMPFLGLARGDISEYHPFRVEAPAFSLLSLNPHVQTIDASSFLKTR